MTEAQIREAVPKQCPKCAKFVEIVVNYTDEKAPGIYCNNCEYREKLPDNMDVVRDYSFQFGRQSLNLLELAPNNPSFRKILQLEISKPVPKTCQTYADIVYWLNRVPLKKAPVIKKPMLDFVIRLVHEYRDIKREKTTEIHSGYYNLSMRSSELVRMIEAQGANSPDWHALVLLMKRHFVSTINEIRPEMPCSNREVTESETISRGTPRTTISDSDCAAYLQQWMISNAPELLRLFDR